MLFLIYSKRVANNLLLVAEDFEKSSSTRSLGNHNLSTTNRPNVNGDLDAADIRGNLQFMRKIPPGAEASNILVGEVEFLRTPITAFIRLKESHPLANLTEVPIPTRFDTIFYS